MAAVKCRMRKEHYSIETEWLFRYKVLLSDAFKFRRVSFVQEYRLCIDKLCTWIILSIKKTGCHTPLLCQYHYLNKVYLIYKERKALLSRFGYCSVNDMVVKSFIWLCSGSYEKKKYGKGKFPHVMTTSDMCPDLWLDYHSLRAIQRILGFLRNPIRN